MGSNMTQNEYASEITRIIDEQHGHSFEYPDSFDSDVAAYFLQRLEPQDAAEKLLAEWDQDVA